MQAAFVCLLTLLPALATGPRHHVAAAAGHSAARQSAAVLTVRGISAVDVTLTAADIASLPHHAAKVTDAGGNESTYEGASLSDVMKRAGFDFQSDRHGRGLTRYLLVEAADKYRVVVALPEFDPDFTDRLILVASTRDGKPLSAEEGPLRIIAPDDKRPARWVRQVRLLTVVDAVSPADRNRKP